MKTFLSFICGITLFGLFTMTKSTANGNGNNGGTQDTTSVNQGITIIDWRPIEIGGGGEDDGGADDAD